MVRSRKELFNHDKNLHMEADKMLKETSLGKIIQEAGYKPVGSYVMNTMTWRDLDFERSKEPPDWNDHWELGNKLARLGFIWKFSCVDSYNDRRQPLPDNGLYWGLQFDYPKGGAIWKIDLWTARQSEWERILLKRLLWNSRLTDDKRYHILRIKDAVCNTPEYRQTLFSVHIYEAVLEYNIKSFKEFQTWWQARYGK